MENKKTVEHEKRRGADRACVRKLIMPDKKIHETAGKKDVQKYIDVLRYGEAKENEYVT